MVLTPESTGTPEQSNDATGVPAKKSRRQTAFYPNINSTNKPQKYVQKYNDMTRLIC